MCNAWNHPPSCACGWGGDGHLGSGGGGSVLATRGLFSAVPNQFKQNIASIATEKRFLNPNARCPVCDEPVYFFQSENGGRVFFDDIGPPWPKHPCTDNPIAKKNTVLAAPALRGRAGNSSRWRVLQHTIIIHTQGILTLQGLVHDIAEEHSFYFTGACRLNGHIKFLNSAFIDALPPENGEWPVILMHSDQDGNLRFKDVKLFLEARTKIDVETWERALDGIPAEQNAVAWTLSFGVAKNPVVENCKILPRIARHWFNICAQAGEWVGYHNLGVMHLQGLGGDLNEAEAFRNLKEAARSFEPVSLRRYAEFYRNGTVCEKNEEIADALDVLASFELAEEEEYDEAESDFENK